MCGFCHLHVHTGYSFLDGANKIEPLIQRAMELEQPALAITDHGNMHGCLELYQASVKKGVKPIIGCELYVAPGSRFERERKFGEHSYHLTVIAHSNEGYRNLCALTTAGYREGFYYKPRVDRELLKKHSAGLIVLSGCLGGELAHAIRLEHHTWESDILDWYSNTFPGRYYLEVQPHAIDEQAIHNDRVRSSGRDWSLPVVATGDCHYTYEHDRKAQDVLLCVSMGTTIEDATRLSHGPGMRLHLSSREEMLSWQMLPEELEASLRIAQSCALDLLPDKYFMPKHVATLSELDNGNRRNGSIDTVYTDLKRRIGPALWKNGVSDDGLSELPTEYGERLKFEIELIEKMGFRDYFNIVADFISWAKSNSIPVGAGRGSVAGSLVAYAIGITDIDPIKYGLLFERFLNPDRVSLPDIDVDFCPTGRERVIDYVRVKYGEDAVAQIATFGSLQARSALKDVCRALGRPISEATHASSLVPLPKQGFQCDLKTALHQEPKLKAYAEGEGREVVELALRLEGLTRHVSTHAAGVVIGDRPLVEHLPLMLDKEGKLVTQYEMKCVEKIGLVKFDFLGLKTLTVLHAASRLSGVAIPTEPTDDEAIFSMLQRGETTGVFQLESGGITEVVRRLKPTCFSDLVAILALYRPGPLESGMVDRYIERKNGREEVEVLHPLMAPVLEETYGIMLYQEQIMELARVLAGYTLAEADILRKAMGKKDPEEMARQRLRFEAGCKERGIRRSVASDIFDQMETFARYGFNKSHSVAYALIAYQTAHYKAHHPVEYMAALMSNELDRHKVQKNVSHCRELTIAVLPPNINRSSRGFGVDDGAIRFGLDAVDGVGGALVDSILKEREAGPFTSLIDFIERMLKWRLNTASLDSLIAAGAFDEFGARKELVAVTHAVIDNARRNRSRKKPKPHPDYMLTGDEWPQAERLQKEREALGVYLSGHPIERFRKGLTKRGIITVDELGPLGQMEGCVCGMISEWTVKSTKKGDRYASFCIEDETDSIRAIIWPKVFSQVHSSLVAYSNSPILFAGHVELDSADMPTFFVDHIQTPNRQV